MEGRRRLQGPRGAVHLLRDGSSIANFAVVSWCNAKCVFCSYPDAKERKEVRLEDGRRAIDALRDLGVAIVSLTGGEPFLDRDLFDIAEYASGEGLIVFTGTNGTFLTPATAARLARAEVQGVWISYEGPDAETFDRNRGVPGLTEKIRRGLQFLDGAGVNAYCICVVNRTVMDVRRFVDHIADIGYTKVKFDYPMTRLESSYLGFSDWSNLHLSAAEMGSVIDQILELKRERYRGVEVLNPTEGLRGAARFWAGEPPRFPCFAGEKILYLDWNLDLWRCTTLPEKFGKVWEVPRERLRRIDCNRCYYQGVRDYDGLYYFVSSMERGTDALMAGHAFDAARSFLDPHNVAGLRSAIELGTGGFA